MLVSHPPGCLRKKKRIGNFSLLFPFWDPTRKYAVSGLIRRGVNDYDTTSLPNYTPGINSIYGKYLRRGGGPSNGMEA